MSGGRDGTTLRVTGEASGGNGEVNKNGFLDFLWKIQKGQRDFLGSYSSF